MEVLERGVRRRARPGVASTVLLLLLLLLSPLVAGDWPTFRGNRFRQGSTEESELPRVFRKHWVFTSPEFRSPSVDSSPALTGGSVYVGLTEHSVFRAGGRVLCLDAASGKLKWQFRTRFPVFSSPAVAGGRIFVGEGYHQDSGCQLYCLEAATGKELWTFRAGSHVESSPHVDRDRVYFGAGDDGLHCLDAGTGKPVWHFPGEHIDISPLVASGLVFFGTGYGKSAVLCLSARNGKLRWRTPADLPVWGSPLLIGNRLYVGLGRGNFIESDPRPAGGVLCLAAATGKKLWQRQLPDAVLTAISHGGGKLLAGCRDGHLYSLDPARGQVLWRCAAGGPVVASPLVGKERAIAVSATGRLVAVSLDSGEKLAEVDVGALLGQEVKVYSSPAGAAGQVVLGNSSGSVVSLGPGESSR